MMTPEKLDKLEKIAEAATPGPWALGEHNLILDNDEYVLAEAWNKHDGNPQFIAAFNPAVALNLIDTVRRYREALERYAFTYKTIPTEYPHRKLDEYGCADGCEGVMISEFEKDPYAKDWKCDSPPQGFLARQALGGLNDRDRMWVSGLHVDVDGVVRDPAHKALGEE